MEREKKKSVKAIIRWIVWAVVSPFALFSLIISPIGLAFLWVAWAGGGVVVFVAFIALLFTSGAIGARSSGSDSQSGFAKGIVYFLTPFVMLVLYMVVSNSFSDETVAKSAASKAKTLLAKQASIPISGLYTESISLRYSLFGLLVDRQIPVIEGDVAGAKWLFDLAKDQQEVAVKAAGRKYFRLSLGPLESPDCFSWKSQSDNLARDLPVQPRTCIMAVFDNNLVSDTRLHINVELMRNIEREFLRFQADLPVLYVRREDYVRGQSVIEAKLDALYSKLEVVQLKGAKND